MSILFQMDRILQDGDMSNFRIHVHTGNKLGASTRADVKLVVYGDRGRTREIFLNDCRNHKIKFQKGQVCVSFLQESSILRNSCFVCSDFWPVTKTIISLQEDIFDIDEVSVGPIRKIAIGHDRGEISKLSQKHRNATVEASY